MPAAKQAGSSSSTLETFIPAEHHDKWWFKDAAKSEDPTGNLIKTIDNLHAKIGEKTLTPPGADATDEQRKAWDSMLGVPEKPDAYEFPEVKWESEEQKKVADALAAGRSPEFNNGLKALFHKAKLTPAQVATLVEGHDRLFIDLNGEALAKEQQTAAAGSQEFAKAFNDHFGSTDAKQVKERVWKQFEDHIPDKYKGAFDRMDNEQLLAASIFADAQYKRYGREDKINQQSGAGSSTNSIQSIRDERMKLLQQREGKSPNDPAYIEASRKIEELNLQWAALKA